MQNVFPGGLTRVDTAPAVPLGTMAEGTNGERYIYLQGVIGTVRGAAVTYSSAYLSNLTVLATRGPVAFALAAVVANQYGWYQVTGRAPGRSNAAIVIGTPLYATAGGGQVDDAVTAGSQISGAFAASAPGGAAADMDVQANFPFMSGLG